MTASTILAKFKKPFYKILAIAFWIIVWEALALAIGSELIIASPVQVVKTLFSLVVTASFWSSLLYSTLRILGGFLMALLIGVALAAVSSRVLVVRSLLEPITSVIKATPVASFIILAIIWFGSKNLAIFISFLMVFPVIYLNVLKGIESTDVKLLEMARVYRFSPLRVLLYIYLPEVMPFFVSACSIALGLCWKSGVAAEVIGITTGSIGENLYRAKLYFETGELLAWTAVIIAVSTVFEKLFMLALKKAWGALERRYKR
ncbi:MAG: ABC transporter permease subunit [Oscillospiraceae bacterium]|nr:ABC transporter permease subunit [Oscillospiraceae bacterium]